MVDIKKGVAINHGDGIFVAILQGIDHGTAGSQRRQLTSVVNADAAVFMTEEFLHLLVQVACGQHHMSIALLLQPV